MVTAQAQAQVPGFQGQGEAYQVNADAQVPSPVTDQEMEDLIASVLAQDGEPPISAVSPDPSALLASLQDDLNSAEFIRDTLKAQVHHLETTLASLRSQLRAAGLTPTTPGTSLP